VKLTRHHTGDLHAGSDPDRRHYRIDDTAISVEGTQGSWELAPETPHAMDWLTGHGLLRAAFLTRRAALRAYQAAAALNPPPQGRKPRRLDRVSAGRYRLFGATVDRHPDGRSWVVRAHGLPTLRAITLTDAETLIADARWAGRL